MEDTRIAWAVTGAGHTLDRCMDLLLRLGGVDVYLSRAAEEVLRVYRQDARLEASGAPIYREKSASSPAIGRFFSGRYRLLVIAPATSNSVAKFVHGISDSLVSNLFSQAGKSRVPTVVYPTDIEAEMDSQAPRKELVKVYPRAIDLENTRKLDAFEGVRVVRSPAELERFLESETQGAFGKG